MIASNEMPSGLPSAGGRHLQRGNDLVLTKGTVLYITISAISELERKEGRVEGRRDANSPVHGALVLAGQLEDVACLGVVHHAAHVGVAVHGRLPVVAGPAAHVGVKLARAVEEAGDVNLRIW